MLSSGYGRIGVIKLTFTDKLVGGMFPISPLWTPFSSKAPRKEPLNYCVNLIEVMGDWWCFSSTNESRVTYLLAGGCYKQVPERPLPLRFLQPSCSSLVQCISTIRWKNCVPGTFYWSTGNQCFLIYKYNSGPSMVRLRGYTDPFVTWEEPIMVRFVAKIPGLQL